MRPLRSTKIGLALLAVALTSVACRAAEWFPLGPYGGNALSLAVDPSDSKHLFLGTATGWIYDSHDGGTTWAHVAQIAKRNDLVVDHILADEKNPKRLIVAAYLVDHPSEGGLYISEDYGKNWYSQAQLRGQSVRSLARSASNSSELVAGTLKGVFLSLDNGMHWKQISPEGSTEIHEVQSVAIDPVDPNVIYAGTWHLPWKTTDGGATWHNIKEGIIDDSDVFSIIVDPKKPNTIYASACSGIYKSADGGDLFHKVQGIPSTARRTRKLEQDPEHLGTVFAGTTEGLYRTLDAGAQWERLTPADVIVNDVYVDPSNTNHVLLATDRGGVYRSEDGGSTFEPSNTGFSARQVIAYAADPQNPNTLYVGVVNDKATGGVFESTDGAVHWQQQSDGLGGRDVFSLVSLADGTLLAGTEHGIYRLADGHWADSGQFEGQPPVEKAKAPNPQPTRIARPVATYVPARGTHSVAGRKAAVRRGSAKGVRPSGRGAQRLSASSQRRRQVVSARKVRTRGPAKARTRRAVLVRAAMPVHPQTGARKPHAESPTPALPVKVGRVDTVIYNLVRSGDVLYAASGAGLLRSDDGGSHWATVKSLTLPDVRFVAVTPVATLAAGADAPADSGSVLLAGALGGVAMSRDGGATWAPVTLPSGLTQVGAVGIDRQRNLWVGGREGVWISPDAGATWKTLRNLFVTEVDSLYFDASGNRMLVTSAASPVAFSVQLPDEKVSYWDTGWKLRFVRPVGDHLVGATLFEGMVVQPVMVDSAAGPTAAALK